MSAHAQEKLTIEIIGVLDILTFFFCARHDLQVAPTTTYHTPLQAMSSFIKLKNKKQESTKKLAQEARDVAIMYKFSHTFLLENVRSAKFAKICENFHNDDDASSSRIKIAYENDNNGTIGTATDKNVSSHLLLGKNKLIQKVLGRPAEEEHDTNLSKESKNSSKAECAHLNLVKK